MRSLKIVLTGPESSGKTRLAQSVSRARQIPLVPELARPYLSVLNRAYGAEDLPALARGQLALEASAMGLGAPWILCDTSMLVLKIWSAYRYGQVHPFIEQSFRTNQVALYCLCQPDLPYEPDPLRENAADRWSLYYLYEKALLIHQKNYVTLSGPLEQRLVTMEEQVDILLLGQAKGGQGSRG